MLEEQPRSAAFVGLTQLTYVVLVFLFVVCLSYPFAIWSTTWRPSAVVAVAARL